MNKEVFQIHVILHLQELILILPYKVKFQLILIKVEVVGS